MHTNEKQMWKKEVTGKNMRVGFDNDKYLKMQSEHIEERISKFGDKLYLEFGVSCLMISMLREYCPDLSLTVSFEC